MQNGKNIEAEQISLLVLDALEKRHNDATYFAGLIGSLQFSFLNKINMSLNDLVMRNFKLKQNSIMMGKLLALCDNISKSKVLPSA
jgi:K+/H+ antiporter YhaU regulatory subunit KhtT